MTFSLEYPSKFFGVSGTRSGTVRAGKILQELKFKRMIKKVSLLVVAGNKSFDSASTLKTLFLNKTYTGGISGCVFPFAGSFHFSLFFSAHLQGLLSLSPNPYI